ncbi:armadillo repeat-containing protein 12-like isoform X2 [Paroedura picta]|uniref:armadillo repeat-containing protein 12-like isoform X2 n=1 Tax=Paroedura picta TaxID=143630 RepID=UPI004056E689
MCKSNYSRRTQKDPAVSQHKPRWLLQKGGTSHHHPATACTYDDIKLVASFLDDPDKAVRTEALNALRPFTNIWKFKIKIQEYIPKIMELVVNNWDGNLQAAGLRLMNAMNVPDHSHPLLKRLLPNLMNVLLMANTVAKVQVLKLLSAMAQKEDLLIDILNCQAPPDFLSFFLPSLPEHLLYEMLVFVEQLSEGRLTPQYQSTQWQYNDLSLHTVIFGDNTHLSDRLLALVVHPEEEVQLQACRAILSLRLNKDGNRVISNLPFSTDISAHNIASTRSNQPNLLPFDPSISSSPATSSVTEDSSCAGSPTDDAGHNFQPLQSTNGSSQNSYPSQSSGNHFRPLHSSTMSTNSSIPVIVGPTDAFQPIAAACSDDDSDNG